MKFCWISSVLPLSLFYTWVFFWHCPKKEHCRGLQDSPIDFSETLELSQNCCFYCQKGILIDKAVSLTYSIVLCPVTGRRQLNIQYCLLYIHVLYLCRADWVLLHFLLETSHDCQVHVLIFTSPLQKVVSTFSVSVRGGEGRRCLHQNFWSPAKPKTGGCGYDLFFDKNAVVSVDISVGNSGEGDSSTLCTL